MLSSDLLTYFVHSFVDIGYSLCYYNDRPTGKRQRMATLRRAST